MKCVAPLGASAIATALVLVAAVAAHADGLQAGQWKVVSKPENNGVSGPQMENMRCLTEDDVKDLDRTFSPVSRTTNLRAHRA